MPFDGSHIRNRNYFSRDSEEGLGKFSIWAASGIPKVKVYALIVPIIIKKLRWGTSYK